MCEQLRHRPECWSTMSPSLPVKACAEPQDPAPAEEDTWISSQESQLPEQRPVLGSSPEPLLGSSAVWRASQKWSWGLLRAVRKGDGIETRAPQMQRRGGKEGLSDSLSGQSALAYVLSQLGRLARRGRIWACGLSPPSVLTALGTAPHPRISSLTDKLSYWSLSDQLGMGAACQEGDKGHLIQEEERPPRVAPAAQKVTGVLPPSPDRMR